jgi:beta-lactamase regulating signal transducer with metallopeptidase domain
MNLLEWIGSTPVVQALGLALVHFIWQGFIIGVILALSLMWMRTQPASSRYFVCLIGMIAMLVTPVITTLLLLRGPDGTAGLVAHGIRVIQTEWLVGTPSGAVCLWITAIWVCGAFALQLRFGIKLLCAERIRHIGLTPVAESLHGEMMRLRDRLGIGQTIHLMESALVAVPSVIGWRHPLILIPAGIAARLPLAHIRGIIAHELAHIRRHDYIVNLVQSLFESVLFYHPVTWWISNRLRIEREFCCDDIALSVSDSPMHYARALSALEELRCQGTDPVIASTGGSLMKRIVRIFNPDSGSMGGRGWLVPVAGLVGMTGMVAIIMIGCGFDSPNGAVTGVAPAVAGEATPMTISENGQEMIFKRMQEAMTYGSQEAMTYGEMAHARVNNTPVAEGESTPTYFNEDSEKMICQKLQQAITCGEMTQAEADEVLRHIRELPLRRIDEQERPIVTGDDLPDGVQPAGGPNGVPARLQP